MRNPDVDAVLLFGFILSIVCLFAGLLVGNWIDRNMSEYLYSRRASRRTIQRRASLAQAAAVQALWLRTITGQFGSNQTNITRELSVSIVGNNNEKQFTYYAGGNSNNVLVLSERQAFAIWCADLEKRSTEDEWVILTTSAGAKEELSLVADYGS